MYCLKAIIFDFDGVLADTEPLHYRMFERVLGEQGIVLTYEEYERRYIGLTDEECFQAVCEAQRRPLSGRILRNLMAYKTELMQQALCEQRVLIPGVQGFVKAAAERYRLAIASGALRKEIELVLDHAGLRDLFEHISSAEDVSQGKPQPDLYLHAVAWLNASRPLRPSECLAIEDTAYGVTAAQRAGLRCLAVATSLDPIHLAHADAVMVRLGDCDLSPLIRRFWAGSATGRVRSLPGVTQP